jgi:leucyl-tRNA synthetase
VNSGQSTVGKTERIQTLISVLEKEGNKNIKAVCDDETPIITAEQWKKYNEQEKENFLQNYRIAYRSETMVNWCPALGTVLSNDEVKDGVSERGGYPVERKEMWQWSMRISAYAERLLTGLDTIDWPEPVREMQRNWIGKSTGCELSFSLIPNPSPAEKGTGSAKGAGYETSEKKYWHILKQYSKENRKDFTESEDIIWQEVRNSKLGHKIRRQHAIGTFIADFICLDRRTVIEIDGVYHLNNKEYDDARTSFLNEEGFSVIRFTNEEVKSNIKDVLSKIKSTLDNAVSIKAEPGSLSTGEGRGEAIDVFTTRIDTIYGVTFMVLAPEHELVAKITTPAQKAEVEKYVEVAKNRSERERMTEVKRITGAFTGAYAINPFNNAKIPVWIADYVLAGYGTGAVMAVPSSDTRDYAFAKHFNLPIIDVLEGPTSDITKDNFDPKSGKMINSDSLNGLDWKDAIEKALQKVEQLGIGKRKVNYRMRDAIFGRQRYWGEPFPVYYENGIPKLVELKELPVTLPEINEYKPTETGEPPLGRAINWNHKGKPYELTTMPGWAGSSWYWFRYMDPKNDTEFASKNAIKYWKDVDLYMGGSEHATGHLLYSRFWCKALKDLGYVDSEEPFKKLINQGHIQGVSQWLVRGALIPLDGTVDNPVESKKPYKNIYHSHKLPNNKPFEFSGEIFRAGGSEEWRIAIEYISPEGRLYKDKFIELTKDPRFLIQFDSPNDNPIDKEIFWEKDEMGKEFILTRPEVEKMSKSKWNVVNPDNIVKEYGADTLRMYEMFLGPLEQSKPWNTQGIDGVFKFLRRFWNLFHDAAGNFKVSDAEPTKDELKVLHKTLKKIQQDIENFSFNTSVSEFMICSNELSSLKSSKRALLEPLVIALAPFAPHIAEELWEKLGHSDTVFNATFPKYDEQYLIESSFNYPISINGKVRAQMSFALDMPKEDIEKVVMASEIVQKWSEGKPPKKVIIVPGKIVNVVL